MHCRRFVPVASIAAVFILGAVGAAASAEPQANASFQRQYETGQPMVVRGAVTTVYGDDFAAQRAEIVHMLRDVRTGRRFTLRFDREPKGLRAGAVVQLNARAHGSTLYVLADQLDPGAVGSGGEAVTAAATPPPGDQPTLVMVTNFMDAAVSCSDASISDMMFTDPGGNSVSELYRASSLGAVSLSGSVTDVTIPFASTDPCDISTWADAADQQAAAKGLNPMAYAHRVYVLPPSMCIAAGYGTVGGTPSGAWIFTCDVAGVYAHELGHNLGMDHASTPTAEYGDTTDPMAYSSNRLRGVNAPHRRQLGWLGAQSVERVTASGTYDVAALALDPSTIAAPQVLEIAKPDTGDYYYLSYRAPFGFDSYIDGTYYNRLSVHEYRGDGSPSRTFLLDGLDDGASFTDTINGITVTQSAHGATDAMVQVQFDSACVPAVPLLTVTPQTQSGVPATALDYQVSVTNRDTAQCGSSSFALASGVPSGWSVVWQSSSLSLSPGTTGTAIVSVTSSSAAQAGTYDVTVTAATSGVTVHSTSASLSYAVQAPCMATAPAVFASPATQSGTAGSTLTYTLTITNRDSASCGNTAFGVQAQPPAGWAASLTASVLTLAPGASGGVSVLVASPGSTAAGNYSVGTTVTDGTTSGHATATAVVDTVTAPADTTPPTAPSGLTASLQQKKKQIQLSWSASTDNVGVIGYRVVRDGAVVATVSDTLWGDGSYSSGASYTYAVQALDAAGNVSLPSNAVTVSTGGGAGGGGGGKKR